MKLGCGCVSTGARPVRHLSPSSTSHRRHMHAGPPRLVPEDSHMSLTRASNCPGKRWKRLGGFAASLAWVLLASGTARASVPFVRETVDPAGLTGKYSSLV